ncbi:MAG: DNA cytosine methyltransferase, partial [Phycisphaerae bacterium]
FVMENVPGLAASRVEGVRLTDVLRGSFEEEGYSVTVMKLTASDFLVPQRRKRVFIVGCRDRPVPVPDPRRFARERYGVTAKDVDISARAAIGDLGPCVAKGDRAPYSGLAVTLFAKLMRAHEPAGGPTLHECPRMSATDSEIVRHIPPGGNYRDIPDEIAPGRVLKFKKTGGRTTTYGRLHPDKPAYTINTYFRRPNVGCNFHYEQPRLITPREAMRFQSLPDHFELRYGSQDERNALIGNAVPPLLAEAIAWTVKEALDGRTCELPLLFCGS